MEREQKGKRQEGESVSHSYNQTICSRSSEGSNNSTIRHLYINKIVQIHTLSPPIGDSSLVNEISEHLVLKEIMSFYLFILYYYYKKKKM